MNTMTARQTFAPFRGCTFWVAAPTTHTTFGPIVEGTDVSDQRIRDLPDDGVDGCGAVLGVLFMGFCLGWLTGWLLTCRAYERAALDAGHAEIVDGRFEWLPVGDVAGGGE